MVGVITSTDYAWDVPAYFRRIDDKTDDNGNRQSVIAERKGREDLEKFLQQEYRRTSVPKEPDINPQDINYAQKVKHQLSRLRKMIDNYNPVAVKTRLLTMTAGYKCCVENIQELLKRSTMQEETTGYFQMLYMIEVNRAEELAEKSDKNRAKNVKKKTKK